MFRYYIVNILGFWNETLDLTAIPLSSPPANSAFLCVMWALFFV